MSNSKEAILKAAKTIFAEKGFYGARINDITAASGVNVRIIYHFFGSKEKLYCNIIQEVAKKCVSGEAISSNEVRMLLWEAACQWACARQVLSDEELQAVCYLPHSEPNLHDIMKAGATFSNLISQSQSEVAVH